MTSHNFHHDGAFVTGGGSVQPIKRIHHRVDGGVKTESHRGRFQVIVDCLGNTDTVDPSLL